MAILDSMLLSINRVAETHFMLRPVMINALKQQKLTDYAISHNPGKETYYDIWTSSYSDRFYDMGVLIRLGSVLDSILKEYYMNSKGHTNIMALKADPQYEPNIFQRIMPWTNKNVISIYLTIGVDLTQNQHLSMMQELMLHRHFFAHNLGILDEKYISDYNRLTGNDLKLDPTIMQSYPAQDTYWFEPLKKINEYIEGLKLFVKLLP